MNWIAIIVAVAIVAVFLVIKRAGQISPKDAQDHLKKGAQVIDVRSSSEFSSGHLPNVINIPLGDIETALPRRVKDKSQVLLLHCHSGMRSAAAMKTLKGMGYANTFNLGSYSRAESILKQSE